LHALTDASFFRKRTPATQARAKLLWISRPGSESDQSVTGAPPDSVQGHPMTDKPVFISTTLISLGAERPMHMAVDAAENVPFAPSTHAAPGEERPLQVVDLDNLHAALDVGRLPDVVSQVAD
jgi:hypothetical protein